MDSFLGPRGRMGRSMDWVALIGAVAVIVIAASITGDVIMRWIFNAPILAVDDLNRYNIAIVIASFFPLCLVGKHLVTIRFLGRALGVRCHLWLEVAGATITLFAMALYSWQFILFAIRVTENGLASGVLEVPQWPWWWVVAVVVFIAAVVQFGVLVHAVYQAVTGEAVETEGESHEI
ncbi:MAG: TRAP transporter small permease [Rhodospirillales bacterium]|nr:TRAP transporter small permease [Rhodospirillales bacterium]